MGLVEVGEVLNQQEKLLLLYAGAVAEHVEHLKAMGMERPASSLEAAVRGIELCSVMAKNALNQYVSQRVSDDWEVFDEMRAIAGGKVSGKVKSKP